MTNTKHTPGPWEVKKELTGLGNVEFLITDGLDDTPDGADTIAHVIFSNEAQANARLIAAAPDLLEACIGALHALEQHGENFHPSIQKHTKAAIAKATGEA